MCEQRAETVKSRSKSNPGTTVEAERNQKYHTDTTGQKSENRRVEVQILSRVPISHLMDCNVCCCCLVLGACDTARKLPGDRDNTFQGKHDSPEFVVDKLPIHREVTDFGNAVLGFRERGWCKRV